jgi:protoheme IX farnesyltransferase
MKLENRHPPASKFLAYIDLTKPRIIVMILVTTAFSFYLAAHGFQPFNLLVGVLIGTALLKGGAATLNHYLERDVDNLMERTKFRPLPQGIIPSQNALSIGLILILFGIVVLLFYVNLLTAFLGLLSAFLYVLIYTPAKRITWINTSIGAIPGALPAMGGWAAATGTLDWGAWIMFGIIFFWQHPHFYAIATMCRQDYRKAGFKMLPVLDWEGARTVRHMIWHTLFLIPVSLMPVFLGLSGYIYFTGVLLLGIMYLLSTIPLAREYSAVNARKVLKASIVYLPALLILIVSDTAF